MWSKFHDNNIGLILFETSFLFGSDCIIYQSKWQKNGSIETKEKKENMNIKHTSLVVFHNTVLINRNKTKTVFKMIDVAVR